MQTLTKRVRQLEEDFEQTETRLHAANEKFAEASKAADESERSASTHSVRPAQLFTSCFACGFRRSVAINSIVAYTIQYIRLLAFHLTLITPDKIILQGQGAEL